MSVAKQLGLHVKADSPTPYSTDTPAAAPITAERLHEALTLAREYVLAATYRPDSNNFIRIEASRRLAIIDAALSAPVAAQPAASGVDAAMKLADEYANTLAATPFCGQAEIDIAREALRAHLSTALTGAAKE